VHSRITIEIPKSELLWKEGKIAISPSKTFIASDVKIIGTEPNQTPERVTAGFVDLALKFDLTSGEMVEAKVSWVAPKIKKLGVRTGDHLTVVDGKPSVNWSRSDFDSYLDAGLIEGKSAVFAFVGSRWLVMEHTFTITLKKELNQSLVPTPASVTPAADAPVAPDGVAAHP